MTKKELKQKISETFANEKIKTKPQHIRDLVDVYDEQRESILKNYGGTIAELRKRIVEKDDAIEELRKLAIQSIEQQHDQHEKQMQVAESEINRLNVIINFLYMHGRE